MSKKIVILNGSPRPKGNTSALVEEFKRGAEEAGCTVTVFVLDKMDINRALTGTPLSFVSPHLLKRLITP